MQANVKGAKAAGAGGVLRDQHVCHPRAGGRVDGHRAAGAWHGPPASGSAKPGHAPGLPQPEAAVLTMGHPSGGTAGGASCKATPAGAGGVMRAH
jgi:hypothetical protein